MATYLGTHGSRIQNYTTDPDNPNTGEVWYNATANTIKIEAGTTAGSWSSGGNLNTARNISGGAGADSTSALAYGGYTTTYVAVTEEWNGTNWTEVNNLNTARRMLAGDGTSTAALGFGGNPPNAAQETESWNGTNWTAVANMSVGKDNTPGGAGTNTAALAFGGEAAPGVTVATEEWNDPGIITKTLTT